MFGVGHAANEMGQAVMIVFCRNIVDNHQVENQSVCFVVLKCPKHFLGEARLLHAIYLHQHDGKVAADAKPPQATLRQVVLGKQLLAVIA